MQDVETVQVPTVRDALDLAAVAIKRGDIPLGRARLEWVLERDPENVLAWLWSTKCTDARDEQIRCFYRALSVDPTNRHALEGLKRLKVPVPTGSANAPRTLNPVAPPPPAPIASRNARAGDLPTASPAAGTSTRQLARKRKTRAIAYAIVGLVAVALIGLAIQNGSALGSGGVLVLYLLLLTLPRSFEKGFGRRMKWVEDADRGAEGEEAVGRILECLGDDHLVLHDVPSPYGNIDHIVISRQGGIYLLETKAHGGRVDVIDGRFLLNQRPPDKDFISQVLRNTYWLRDKVAPTVGEKPWITALLVFTNAFVPRVPPVKGVRILNKRFLLEALQDAGNDSGLNGRIWDGRGEIQRVMEHFER
jgi:hypothetical protein